MSRSVQLTRRVCFSSGHRYWFASMTAEENRALFGAWASPFNHGHNYVLDVTVGGIVDPATGMVVNIKRIDDVLQEKIVRQFDGKSMNDEVAHFLKHTSCLENLLAYIASTLQMPDVLPPEVRLSSLRLEEMPTLYAELNLDAKQNAMTITRSYEFAAAHRLDSPELTHQENLDLFGKCNNPAGHGHNYILEVSVAGEPDPRTGMIIDLEVLDRTVNDLVVDRYDHKNLNVDIPEFQGRNTTSEVVVLEIFDRLKESVPGTLQRVRLQETARNIFEVSA